MIFKKKKRMIDMRELQRRGVVRIPEQNILAPTNQDGFIELNMKTKQKITEKKPTKTSTSSNADFFGFINSNSSTTTIPSTTSRAESERITELDNKIYKLEQRIELLEKKLDVNQSSKESVGVMGW